VGPSYERYVASLPRGLASHPTAQAKGSIIRSHLEAVSPELVAAFPPPLRQLAAEPPMDSDWVPETYLCALIHAIAERRGYAEREFLTWIRARNRALFTRPLYAILMAVATPEVALRAVGKRWGNFHRGTTLALEGFGDDGVRVALSFPAGLFDSIMLHVFAEAFAAALEAAHAKNASVVLEASGAGFARYLARW
jgi:hypothetical protein